MYNCILRMGNTTFLPATGAMSDNAVTVHTAGLPAGTYRLTLFKKDKPLGTQSITVIR
jgi:hypothetical protein